VATISSGGGSIDVATLVSQLMAVERQPLARLQTRETEVQSRLSAFGRVQSAASTLESALAALTRPATFVPATASASGEAATASAVGSAPTGTYAVSVSQLARGQSTVSTQVASASTVLGAGSLTLRDASGTALTTITIGADGTLASVRDAINGAGVGVRASLVGDGGQVRLVLNSAATGTASAFTADAGGALATLGFATPQTARDASFSVNGLALTSATNVVTDAIEGVTLSLVKAPPEGSAPGTTVDSQVTVANDTNAVVKSVQAFVTAYNDLEKLVVSLTKFDPTTRSAAVLNGESALRQMQSQLRGILRGTVSGAGGDLTRLADIGITAQTDGTLALDQTRLTAAAATPARVTRLFANDGATDAEDGFALRLRASVKSMIDSGGVLESRQSGLKSTIKTLDQQQERMEARLAMVQQRLTAQYSALDALVTTRQSQSSALANALSSLPTGVR
jgi:flagellar hook-associated protein 2